MPATRAEFRARLALSLQQLQFHAAWTHVEHVSGQSLRDFLDQRIFAPLGMNATRHVERATEVVSNLAAGYFPAPDGWSRAAGFPLHGEGGLVSCVTDLALWHAHFASPRIGGTALANALTR